MDQEGKAMDQASFEQANLAAMRHVPVEQRGNILDILQTVVQQLRATVPGNGAARYDIHQHREIRKLTSTIRGSLVAAVSTDRDERG